MKIKSYLNVFLFSAIALTAATSCQDEELINRNNIPQGNGIVFGASAGYAGAPGTRTDYGDYVTDQNGNKSQVINWLVTDRVDIYSPESPTAKQVEYGINNPNVSSAYLVALGDGLQWERKNTTQNFYAIYPSKNSMSNAEVKNMVDFKEGVFKGYIPVNQAHKIEKTEKGWVAKPNMDYLYMAAVAKNHQIPVPDSNDGVSLSFVPLTSTLELTIVGPTVAPIASLNVFANDKQNIAGFFKCDLTKANSTSEGNSDLKCDYEESSTVRDMITIDCYYSDGDKRKPLELAAGESVTFNVFLLPHTKLTNLSIRIAGYNTASKTMALNDVTLYPHQKTCVKVDAPQIAKDGVNNWITGMDGKVLLSQLSIPGTANSFSYKYSGTNSDYYKAQTVDFDRQWNAGIRCFELRCPNNVNGNSLDNVQLQCNRENLGITFGQAVDMIWSKVQGTGEFAMIMPAFETSAGRGGNVTDFANDLNQFFIDHSSYKYVTYGSNLSLDEVRGSLMFVARITSEEDNGLKLDKPGQGVLIDQWGSLKDNWQRRGYPVDNWAVNSRFGNSMEDKMLFFEAVKSNPTTVPSLPLKGEVNYIHNTLRSDGSTGTAYIQDWARVVEKSKSYALYHNYSWHVAFPAGNYKYEKTKYAYWKESLGEKQDDIWNTFELAIADNNGKPGSTFYINCLDGYFVDENVPESFKPYIEGLTDHYMPEGGLSKVDYGYGNGGIAGNIDAFATSINNWFYNKILEYGASNIYGPMNIVILDRVYEKNDDGTDGGGSYLPSVIINNNYRFPLITKDKIKTDASYESGGNVIE